MYNDGDNEPRIHHRITSGRPLTAQDKALLATPEARALAARHPAWGPERIKAEMDRTSGRR